MSSPPAALTTPEAFSPNWIGPFWYFFLYTAICSLLGGTVVALSLIWVRWDTGLPLQALGTSTTVLFAASMGLLVTYMSSSTAQRPLTRAIYVLALGLIGLSTTVCIQAIWFDVDISVPVRALGTSFVLFPATLALLKLTTMFQLGSRSHA